MARIEQLRDQIVLGNTTGQNVDELFAEREALKRDRDAELIEKAETERAAHVEALNAQLKSAARALIDKLTWEQICEQRAAARVEWLKAKARFDQLSRAKQFIEAGKRLDAELAKATDEEREAWLLGLDK
jgi:hypothetical protein